MKFGLFCSAQANSGDLGPETGQGFRDYLDFIDKFPENEAIYVIVRPSDQKNIPPVARWTAVADAIADRLRQLPQYVQSVDSRVPLDKLGPSRGSDDSVYIENLPTSRSEPL